MNYETTQYGFKWGPVEVIRHCSDDKEGWVLMSLKTKREEIEFRVTAGGRFVVRKWTTGG